jgi:50S ribosomal subunit-associated GTPase HflX
MIEKHLDTGVQRVTLKLPYSAAGEVDRLHREAKVFSVEYENDGIRVDAALSRELQGRYRAYIAP